MLAFFIVEYFAPWSKVWWLGARQYSHPRGSVQFWLLCDLELDGLYTSFQQQKHRPYSFSRSDRSCASISSRKIGHWLTTCGVDNQHHLMKHRICGVWSGSRYGRGQPSPTGGVDGGWGTSHGSVNEHARRLVSLCMSYQVIL